MLLLLLGIVVYWHETLYLLLGLLVGDLKGDVLLRLKLSAKGVGRLMQLLLTALLQLLQLLMVDHQILLLHERGKLKLLLGEHVARRLQEEELLLGFAIRRLDALNRSCAFIDQSLLTGRVLHEHHLLLLFIL